jgi:hypothetical protein
LLYPNRLWEDFVFFARPGSFAFAQDRLYG